MTYEYYVNLASTTLPGRLHDGLPRVCSVDHCTVAFAEAELRRVEAKERRDRDQEREQQRERDGARARYTKGNNNKTAQTKPIENLDLPNELALDTVPPVVSKRWMSIVVDFTLLTPWYSKDDRPFHVLDNPVRKDRVFGVPFMAASSWKGLLRWAFRMITRQIGPDLEKDEKRLKETRAAEWHLFGNERNEGEDFSRGALQFLPTWFDTIGFEVINPHGRETRAGTQPIVYEVVPPGTKGQLALLYAPAPGREGPPEAMSKLVCVIEKLLTVYGFFAKRTAGWGLAEIWKCWLSLVRGSALEQSIAARMGGTYEAPSEAFVKLLDKAGDPIDLLWRERVIISKTQFKKLRDRKPCTNQELEAFKSWFARHGEEHKRRLKGDDQEETPRVVRYEFDSLTALRAIFVERRH